MYIRFITFAIFFYFFKKKPPRKYFYLFRLFNIIFLDFDVIRFLSVILDYYNLLTNLENSGHFRQFMVNLENVYRKKKNTLRKQKFLEDSRVLRFGAARKIKIWVYLSFFIQPIFLFFLSFYIVTAEEHLNFLWEGLSEIWMLLCCYPLKLSRSLPIPQNIHWDIIVFADFANFC